MKSILWQAAVLGVSFLYIVTVSDAFVVSPKQRRGIGRGLGIETIGRRRETKKYDARAPIHSVRMTSSSSTSSTVVLPSSESTVGVIGRGYVSVLSAKLAALAGYNVWLLLPPGQQETITELINDDTVFQNLELVEATDTDLLATKLQESEAFLISSDEDIMNESVMTYILDPNIATKVKRVVAMSRNLNGKGMGFFVKASKFSANRQVWDNNDQANQEYQQFEALVKKQTTALNGGGDGDCAYTIVRAGTLKGGGCGDDPKLEQYLSQKFYELTQTDVVNWQLLFDCDVRGAAVTKGDTLAGPGINAVFTAIGTRGGLAGDSSRCAVATAMVESLRSEKTANRDFGVATVQSREPPTTQEWQTLFEASL